MTKDKKEEEKKEEAEEVAPAGVNGKIFFNAVEARDLKGASKKGVYCKVYLDKQKKFKTEVMAKTTEPTWENETRLLILSDTTAVEKVVFQLWTSGALMQSNLGEVSFDVADLLDGVPRDDWFVLKSKGKDRGEIHLQVMFLEPDDSLTKEKDEFSYPLQTLLRKGKLNAWSKIMEMEPDFDKPDSRGESALHVACELGLHECAEILVKREADISLLNKEKQAPIHKAAESSAKCLKVLLDAKADPNIVDDKGASPLHLAAAANHKDCVDILLAANAKVDTQDRDGNTPLHVALENKSIDVIDALVKGGADIHLENKEKLTACALSLNVGRVHEETQMTFFESIQVVDVREFALKKKFSNRKVFAGEGLENAEGDWLTKNPQLLLRADPGTEAALLLHYDDPVSKLTPQMEKCSYLLFPSVQQKFKEVSYWIDNTHYGGVEPADLKFEEKVNAFSMILFGKSKATLGKWTVVVYSNNDSVNITELQTWEHHTVLESKWDSKTAGGCITHPTFLDNPKFSLKIPSARTALYINLEQPRNMADSEPFKIVPYKNFIGFYIFKASADLKMDDPVARLQKFKNVRNASEFLEMDGENCQEYIIIPSTYEPKEESIFRLHIYSMEEITLAPM